MVASVVVVNVGKKLTDDCTLRYADTATPHKMFIPDDQSVVLWSLCYTVIDLTEQ